tara:strand:+ start:662 stop:1540 length:879 start_codon:yes stop_codon:yes gene_type:complete
MTENTDDKFDFKEPEDITDRSGSKPIPPPVSHVPAPTSAAAFEVPRDFVPLPSMGKVYPVSSPLYNKEEVEVRHLTAADEDVLTSRSLLRSGKAIDALLSNCLVDKSIDPQELLSGDKNAVLTFLRVSGYGPEYKVEIDCPSCGENINHTFDLSKLEMNPLDIEPAVQGENNFVTTLPTGTTVGFKFLNSAEEKEISDTLEKLKKMTKSPIDKNVTTRLKNQLISVNGNTDGGYIAQYVDSMPVRDSRSLRKYMDDNSPDVIMKQEYGCPHCGDEQEVEIPITVSFFWPDGE